MQLFFSQIEATELSVPSKQDTQQRFVMSGVQRLICCYEW